jgi:hypothetical protein
VFKQQQASLKRLGHVVEQGLKQGLKQPGLFRLGSGEGGIERRMIGRHTATLEASGA